MIGSSGKARMPITEMLYLSVIRILPLSELPIMHTGTFTELCTQNTKDCRDLEWRESNIKISAARLFF